MARAQPSKKPTVGFLGAGTAAAAGQWVAAVAQRLRELGWTEGRTVAIEYRWAEGRNERMGPRAAMSAWPRLRPRSCGPRPMSIE
jgi:putative ABC transport system substrate-binding protein